MMNNQGACAARCPGATQKRKHASEMRSKMRVRHAGIVWAEAQKTRAPMRHIGTARVPAAQRRACVQIITERRREVTTTLQAPTAARGYSAKSVAQAEVARRRRVEARASGER